MKCSTSLLITALLLLLSSCQSASTVCPPETSTPKYLTALPEETPPSPALALVTTQTEVEIRGKTILVDKVVQGPLCNDFWSGTIYVTCDVQVLEWEEEPLFLKDCNLAIEPGTVVYVAYHNDTAYYNGCSCHTDINPNQ